MVGAEGVAGDFAVADGDKNKKKGGERRCHLVEVGLAGEVVGVEVEVLAGVGVEDLAEVGLGMACPTVILMEDMDQVTHTMVTVWHRPMGTTLGKGI